MIEQSREPAHPDRLPSDITSETRAAPEAPADVVNGSDSNRPEPESRDESNLAHTDSMEALVGALALPQTTKAPAFFQQFGINREAILHLDKVCPKLVESLEAQTSSWIRANTMQPPTIYDENWPQYISDKTRFPQVLAMVIIEGREDQEARGLINETLGSDAKSRLYGGLRGMFLVNTSPAGLMALASRPEVNRIY